MKCSIASTGNEKSDRGWNNQGKIQIWHKIFTILLSFIGNHKGRK